VADKLANYLVRVLIFFRPPPPFWISPFIVGEMKKPPVGRESIYAKSVPNAREKFQKDSLIFFS
jgi:hypothetical protein